MRIVYDSELRKRAKKGNELLVCFDFRYSKAAPGKAASTLQFRMPVEKLAELQEVFQDLLAFKTNHDLDTKEMAWKVQVKRLKDDTVYLERLNLTYDRALAVVANAEDAIDTMVHYVVLEQEYVESGFVFDEPPCWTYKWRVVNRDVCPLLCAAHKTRHCKLKDMELL